MGKFVLKASDDQQGTVIDADTLNRFVAEAKAAAEGDRDAIEVLPASAWYVAQRLTEVTRD